MLCIHRSWWVDLFSLALIGVRDSVGEGGLVGATTSVGALVGGIDVGVEIATGL